MTEKSFTPGELKVIAETGVASVEDVKRMALLLAERDADKKRIAELETRTLNVPTFEEWCQMEDMKPLGWVREAMKEAYDGCRAAAGIKLEVGE